MIDPDAEFSRHMQTLDERLALVERSCAPASIDGVRALVQAVLDVHRSGLREILDLVTTHDQGKSILRALCERASIASLLLMHDLHPDDFGARIERAVREANDSGSGQACAAVVSIDARRVHLCIDGGPPGAALLLRRILERVVCEHAPDAVLEIEGGEPAPHANAHEAQLIPANQLYARAGGKTP